MSGGTEELSRSVSSHPTKRCLDEGLVAHEMRGKLAGTVRYLASNATSQDMCLMDD